MKKILVIALLIIMALGFNSCILDNHTETIDDSDSGLKEIEIKEVTIVEDIIEEIIITENVIYWDDIK